ncbi:GNAT family N-acetyltransferase [Mesobacillus selenatarsenatis]|uniref:GCN5-related N-acetyltransferase n=1 Tax=Mesobacillus selenatarsenatis (strain DSM 18680 / JCM 14380 / FERM P-15431 / SF-1) TaxID=1321606 RepID=A0A0A8X3I6_MESS1|nr:GNAT family N-acetyltransferase [Mesobacillus selenatarsenatis]GAM14540.1 GCN5-related N-acetyltransferase [Mesobacillus selenatarsenatis SF-1]
MDLKIIPLTSKNFSEIVFETGSGLPNIDTIKMLEKKASSETVLKILGVITPKGRLIGYGMYVTGPWDPILEPEFAEVFIKVDPEWRNQGIGGWIFTEIEGIAHQNKSKVLQTQIQDTKEIDLNWAKKKGFDITSHVFESQLDISLFNKEHYSSIFKELESSGIHLTTLDDYPKDKETQNRFWDFWWELVTDVPGMKGKPRPVNDRMIALLKDFDKKGFILAVDGDQWIAMSMVVKETEDVYYNSMTGVDQRFRGKGLAQAVKIKAIEYALQNKVKYIRTHNNSNNTPMLYVNRKLGYEEKPGIYGLTKRIGD